jgi:hypothetical protein
MGTEKTTAPAPTKKPPAKPDQAPAPQQQTGPTRPTPAAPAKAAPPAAAPAKADPAKADPAKADPAKADPAKAPQAGTPSPGTTTAAKPAAGGLAGAMRAVRSPAQSPEQRADAVHRLHRTVGGRQADQLARKRVGAAPSAAGNTKDDPTPGAPDVKVSKPDDPAEKHAEQVARTVAGGGTAHVPPGIEPAKAATLHRATQTPEPEPKPQPQPPEPQPAPESPGAAGHAPAGPAPSTNQLASDLASPDQGMPIPQPTRGILEQRMGADLGHVRVHQGAQADKLARQLQARAFTKGSDIYLAADASPTDLELMAHEATHVLQSHPTTLHRAPSPSPAPPASSAAAPAPAAPAGGGGTLRKVPLTTPKGEIDLDKRTLALEQLEIPAWKVDLYGKSAKKAPYVWQPESKVARPQDQRKLFLADKPLRDQSKNGVTKRAKDLAGGTKAPDPGAPLRFKGHAKSGPSQHFFTGSAEDIGAAILIPPWNHDLGWAKFDVDHQVEWVLGGTNEVSNMWLLDSALNKSAGSVVGDHARAQVKAFLKAAKPLLAEPLEAADVGVKEWTVTWEKVIPGGTGGADVPVDKRWERKDIGGDAHVLGLEPLTEAEQKKASGSPDLLAIYPAKGGGQLRSLAPKGSEPQKGQSPKGTEYDVAKLQSTRVVKGGAKPTWSLDSFTWTAGGPATGSDQEVGHFDGTAFRKKDEKQPIEEAALRIKLLSMPGVEWGGYFDRGGISDLRDKLHFKALSPIVLADLELDLDRGLVGYGIIPKPTLKLLERVQVAVVLNNEVGVGIEATVTGGALNLPGPFKVTGGALTLGIGTGGLMVDGRLDFAIQKLATGYIQGLATAKDGAPSFALEGKLNFDTELFTKAELGLTYQDEKWGVTGELAIGPGKVKGIKSASAKIDVSAETVTAAGVFEPDIKGLESGTLRLKYDPATGTAITGELLLGKGIPGVKSGKLAATVSKPAGGDGWSLAGDGTIEPAIPGVDSQLAISYHDGIFDASAQVAYEKGMLAGQLMLGVTNRSVGEDGKPGEKPGDKLTVYGAGQLTVALAPWLTGTVGVQVKPDGDVKVAGKVALKDGLTLFEEKSIDKELLKIGVDIPIVGVAVAGQRIGIFANIEGSLQAKAGVGPGELRQLSVEVQYDPAHEDQTQITGKAGLYVPAHAGLRLAVRGSLGAGIPIVSARAGLEIGGELGIQGAAEAAVEVNWSPAKGLDIQAEAYVHAEPVFKFDITGFVLVEADLLVTTVELYSKRWKLASFEYGSGLKLGVRVPVHYQEGKPFALSLSDVRFEVPAIDPMKVIGDLVHKIA